MARRRWLALGRRVLELARCPRGRTDELVRCSYDRIAGGYDDAWTHHMRDLSRAMLDRLAPRVGSVGLDLTCGTGFVTGELQRRTGGPTIGVDASAGMLDVARRRCGPACTFVCSDAVEYLRGQPSRSVDVITCAWGLGYTRPWLVLREAARVLRPGGRIGIIDNSLFSLWEVLWASALAFAENPVALDHVMRVRFLPGSTSLGLLMRHAGLGIQAAWGGARTYRVPNGQAAIARLSATGAAAGFEFAATQGQREAVFARFAEVLERRHGHFNGVPITHRYLAAVGRKR
ncbi:MAG: methyltransferase domain-containing protein [Phycisphaerae bacterium]|nr:methyltransferase domain-containing protein [Phycisphaerae bacterium]